MPPDSLRLLACEARVDRPVAMVLAHPDDETVGLSSRLPRMARLTLIYLTDGAPRDLRDAQRAGFSDWRSYAQARQREVEAALALLAPSAARLHYGLPDQQACRHMAALVDRLTADLGGMAAVITHPYEHGHPDHDTAALAVALACRRMGARAPERFEFASYHWRDGSPRFGEFWSDPACPEITLDLGPEALAAKQTARAAYATQARVLASFALSPERLRRAPTYDFSAPAPPGEALYDRFGWDIRAEQWRALAGQALQQL